MKQLTQIQDGVREKGRDESIDLTNISNLLTVNNIYRYISTMHDWPELRRTAQLSTSTTAGQNTYTIDSSVPIFTDIKIVEIQNEEWENTEFSETVFGVTGDTPKSSDLTWKPIHSPPNELEWNLAVGSTKAPYYFMQKYNSEIELRPAPNETGNLLRITGQVEPEELVNLSDVTIFRQKEVDDALEYLISYEVLIHDGIIDGYVNAILTKANNILTALTGKKYLPVELMKRVDA